MIFLIGSFSFIIGFATFIVNYDVSTQGTNAGETIGILLQLGGLVAMGISVILFLSRFLP